MIMNHEQAGKVTEIAAKLESDYKVEIRLGGAILANNITLVIKRKNNKDNLLLGFKKKDLAIILTGPLETMVIQRNNTIELYYNIK